MKRDSVNLSTHINRTVGVISLGCDKNRVDSEKMLSFLARYYKISSDIEKCDVLIINSCAFLESSRKEAIDTAIEYSVLKQKALKKIVMTGCLPQKYADEVFEGLTEVDAFLGTFDYSEIVNTIEKLFKTDERLNMVGCGFELQAERILTTPEHYAYLKIADGCQNHCTYCLIPSIRGKYKSYPMEQLIAEAKGLGELKELILVAQDTTRYGEDLYGENKFVELIQKLSSLQNIENLRLLYCYPEMITESLIEEFNNNDKLIRYIDIPLQHADDRILKLMNRKGSNASYLELVNKLKTKIEGIAIRSTFISSFPSETEEEHNRLIEFIKQAKFFNAGFFAYSREEGTAAYKLKGQIDSKTKKRRVKELYAAQKQVVGELLNSFKGKTIDVVCDGVDYKKQSFYGRAYFNAPDVDGRVYFTSDAVIKQGEKYSVEITQIKGYDLYGKNRIECAE